MKTSTLTRAGVAAVVGAAAASILISQGAFAQGEGTESGFAALIGRDRIHADDLRFQPVAALVVHEATEPNAKGSSAISRYILIDLANRRIVYWPAALGRNPDPPRKLTPSEAVLLEELFSHNLGKSRDAEITKNGFEGTIKPQDLDIKPAELMAKAKARAEAKSKWYGEGAQGMGHP
jgi:hypothetical protein